MAALIAGAHRIGVRVGEGDRWDDLVLRILAERIEPHLGAGRPTFLLEYPVEMAALARVKPGDPVSPNGPSFILPASRLPTASAN